MNDFTKEELEYIRNCMDTYRSDNKELLKKVHLMIDNYIECDHYWEWKTHVANNFNPGEIVINTSPIICKFCATQLFP